MPVIMRARVALTGNAVVGGGVNTFYAASGDYADVRSALEGFYLGLKDSMPSSLVAVIPNAGELLDVETGEVTGIWTDGARINVQGIDSGGFASGVGARIVWETNARTNRRRVRGTTFVVPLGLGTYENDGTIAGAVLSRLDSAATVLRTGLGEAFTIWTRPINGANGKGSQVVGHTVPDHVSWLRTRRT